MGDPQPAVQSDWLAKKERRQRKRVKIAADVRVRSLDASSAPFTEICKTVDVSRDGILFTSSSRNYWKGLALGVTFPYSSAPGALNHERPAEVVRVVEGDLLAVAVHLHPEKAESKEAAAGASHSSRKTAAKPLDRPMVLAVEPEPRAQESLKNLLQPEGYNVVAVANTAEALQILRSATPAVVIAEVEAADTPGYDLCLIIKSDERLSRVPVVLLTRNARPADYAASHSFGAVICMAKPYKPERMLQVVRLVAPPPPKQGASPYGSSRNESSLIERNL